MFNLNKKRLIGFTGLILVFVLTVSFIPSLRSPVLELFRIPFIFLRLVSREVKGLVFYHRNYLWNDRLLQENDLLRQKLNALSETALENERLKGLLELKQSSPYKAIAARVIARSTDNWSQAVVIDKGSKKGIRRGMTVVTYLGMAGRIQEVTPNTSNVMLLSDPNMSVSAICQRSRQEGLVQGSLGGYLVMRYLPESSDIKLDDTIVTSGLNDTFPKGLLLGRVVELGKEFSGLNSFAIIKPAVNLSFIEEVLVIVQ